MPPQLVCFDLGGVLIRLAGTWARACSRAGVPVPAPMDDSSLQARFTEVNDRFERGQVEEARFLEEAAALVGMGPEPFSAAFEAWLQGPYPGGRELVERIGRAGLTTACLSNTSPWHWRLMNEDPRNRLPLDLLQFRFTSFRIGVMKPDPLIFAHVEVQAGAPPETILYFDDDAANVRAARDRGWCAHQIDPRGDTAAQMAERLSAMCDL